MSYKIKIDTFEGPLDLLVYLIENAKMDIYDIEISEITSQYVEYIRQMQNLDIEVGSEFILLAANLLTIKSKLLLPSNKLEETSAEDDPRKQIIDMLMEYKKFKSAAEYLSRLESDGMKSVAKPMEDLDEILNNPIEVLKLSSEEFIKNFEKFLIKKQRVLEIRKRYDNIQRKKITAQERIDYIKELIAGLDEIGKKELSFVETLKNKNDKYDMALSFTSILEMIKQGHIDAKQEKTYGDIKIYKGKAVESIGE